jgi:hypothetical protein
MADLVGKLSQTIKSQVSDFGAGFKQAALSGNPALFGAALNGLEKGLGSIGKEFQKDREERRREKQFQEENQNEQRKLDNDVLKTLKSIEKLMEALVGKKDGKKSFLDALKELFAPLTLAIAGIAKMLEELQARLAKIIQSIEDVFKNVINFFREKLNKILLFFDEAALGLKASFARFIKFFNDLIDRLPNIGEKVTKFFSNIGKYFDDLFEAVKATRFGEIAGSFATKLKTLFTNVFDELAIKLPKIFDVEIDLIKRLKDVFQSSFFNGRLIQSLDDFKLLMGEAGPLGKFATALGLVFQTFKEGAGGVLTKVEDALKGVGNFFKGIAELSGLSDLAKITGEGLSKALKAIPIIGTFLLAIEGIFAFFDTETLQKTFDTEVIGFKERLSGMVGEIFGSLFGLLDLGAELINWAFGIDLRSAKTENGESYEERITSVFSRMIHDILSWFGNFGMLLGGILKLDGPQIKNSIEEMSLIVDDWLTAIRNALAGIADSILEKIPGVDFRFGQRVSRRDASKGSSKSEMDAENRRHMNRAPTENQSNAESKRLQGSKGAEPTKPPSTGRGASSKGMGLTPNAEYAIRFFEAQGYTTAQAAGIVANLQAESGANLKIDAVGDGGKAYGIAQWHPDRQENFRKVFGKDIRNSSLQEQLQFIAWELNNSEKKAGMKVRAAQSEVETAMLFDQYYERSSGEHRQKRMATAQTLYASLGGGGGGGKFGGAPTMYDFGYGASGPESIEVRKTPESINVTARNTSDQIDILARQEGLTREQTIAALDEYKRQRQVDEETRRYRQERANLEDRFYRTLENGFKNMLDSFVGGPQGFGNTASGGARRLIESKVGGAFNKIGTSIFGKQMGGEMGQIFTQLAGSYGDQFATQIIGPALFGNDTKQANRFFNNLASGNKKAATEDLIYGFTKGKVATGMRSALGYEEGVAGIAKDLATVIGGPFSGLFNLDGPVQPTEEQKKAMIISDPIVDAQYGSAQMIVDAIVGGQSFSQGQWDAAKRASRTGGGTSTKSSTGILIRQQTRPDTAAYAGGPAGQNRDRQGAFTNLANAGFNLLNFGATNAITGALGAQNNPFAQAVVGSIVSDFTTSARSGQMGRYDLGQSIGSALGVDVAPGTGLLGVGAAVYSGLNSMVGGTLATGIINSGIALTNKGMAIGQTMQDFGAGMHMGTASIEGFSSAMKAGGSQAAGAIAGSLGNAAIGYTISKTLSGSYSAGSWVNTAAAIASAIPGIGPIAGVIGGLINRTFGRKPPQVTGTGFTGALSEDTSNLSIYQNVVEKGGFLRSDKNYTVYTALGQDIQSGIRNAVTILVNSIRQAGYRVGLGAIDATKAIRTVALGTGTETKTFKYLQPGYNEAYNRGYTPVYDWEGGVYMTNPYYYGEDIKETRTFPSLGGKEITKADKEIIDGLSDGTIAKLSDGTLVRLKPGTVSRSTSSDGIFGGSKTSVNSAQVDIISGLNNAYAIAFENLQKAFVMQISTSGTDIEAVIKNYGDAFIRNSFGTLLDKFAKAGERMYETFDRLTSAIVDFDEAMYKLNYDFIDGFFSNLTGDLFALAEQKDIFMKLYGGREKFIASTTQYFELFYSEAEKLSYYADVGKRQLDLGLKEAKLTGKYSVESLLSGIGEDFETARINYRGIVDNFVEANESLLQANDPETIRQLALLQGDLAAAYYTSAQSIQELNRVAGGEVAGIGLSKKEDILAAAKAIFEADAQKFAIGGIARGPESGYGAMLHGVEAVVPLPNGREIPVRLSSIAGDVGGTTVVNNIVGNGNAAVNSSPTTVFSSPPSAVSSSAPNRVLSAAY